MIIMEDSNPYKWEYYLTLRGGLFYVNPPDAGGPFHSLSEAATAIECHRNWAAVNKRLTNDYYFTLKNGRFRVYPDGAGGPFKSLQDATYAVACDCIWEREEEEKGRKIDIFLKEFDSSVYLPRMNTLKELIRSCSNRDSESPKPEETSWTEDAVTSLDPAILEEADRIERILEEKQLIRNGMKWMESEVLQAFEIYKASSGYRGPKYQFVKLDQQCLIQDSFSKSYHHYNFTMKKKSSFYLRKKREKRPWEYQLFFAEVKPTEEGKKIICRPLQRDENGHCSGCWNVGINLRHPTNGGYEKGNADSGFPFDSFSGGDD